MKKLAPEILSLVLERYGYAELAWTRSIPIPGDPDFPVLQLPAEKLRYSIERGYPVSFEPRLADRVPLLFVQIESFDIARHNADAPGWAIPSKYIPRNEDERINQALGFDEGWEDAEPECVFACDAQFSVFWRAAFERERFGLTVFGTESLYPVALGERELEPIEKILAKWARN